jgi:hypothetical protein
VILLAASVLSLNCFPPVRVTPPPAIAPAESLALAGASVILAAGDIADCSATGDEATARLVDSVLRADSAAQVIDAVITVGDHAYPNGTDRDFAQCFGRSWGDTAKLIMKRIRPSPGNHEHNHELAAPYYRYFGDRAGEPGKGYYAFDVGEWRAIALNSELVTNLQFNAADRKAQEDWLRKELADNNGKRCTLAYFHRPAYSSGGHAGDGRMLALWNLLYAGNVDVIINGHDHHYERFLPMNPAGALDTLRGMVQFIVGTGGADLTGIRPPARNSVSRIQGHFGVLKMTLGAGEYRFAFLDTSHRVWDIGGAKCH